MEKTDKGTTHRKGIPQGAPISPGKDLSAKKWLEPLILISRTERSMNRDPDAYRYKWSNGSKSFQEHLEQSVSKQKSRFQVVFDRLRINQYSIDWSEKKDWNINLIEIIDLIPNPINRITFSSTGSTKSELNLSVGFPNSFVNNNSRA
uniref:Ycf2 N-terminal domain-containing protein n=1 Tax=Solanum lycopersicum TaxID=4081 RepID=A0A3Q7GT60_SOLLC